MRRTYEVLYRLLQVHPYRRRGTDRMSHCRDLSDSDQVNLGPCHVRLTSSTIWGEGRTNAQIRHQEVPAETTKSSRIARALGDLRYQHRTSPKM